MSEPCPHQAVKTCQNVVLMIGLDVMTEFVLPTFGNVMVKKTAWMDPMKAIVLNMNLLEVEENATIFNRISLQTDKSLFPQVLGL